MKKTKMFMLVLTSAVLALTPVTANAAEAAPSQVTETVIAAPSPTPKKPQKKGWVKTKSGIRRYYRKGKRLTGFQKIGKNYFYFSAKGTLLKNTTVNKGYRGFTYYIDNKSHVIGRKKGSTYYTASGKRMTQVQIANLRSKQIAAEITNSSMTQEQKLKACFDWPATFANDHFLHHNGDCVSDAGAFAYLAKAIGYKNVYVCADAVQSNNNAHAWCEINGYVYDPLFAESKSYSKYYGATYGSYGLYPVLKYKIS